MSITIHASGSADHKLARAGEIWAKLMAGNQRFVDAKPIIREFAGRRGELVNGQQAQAVVLGCSDSRVPPSLVFDQGLGQIFEVRTAGNVADPVALGSIEYALSHLPIRIVVVLGHESCGAVAAALSREKMPTVNLRAIVDKIAPAVAKVKGESQSPDYVRRVEEENVRHSAADLVAHSPIVMDAIASKNVQIIKALYSLTSGQVTRLAD